MTPAETDTIRALLGVLGLLCLFAKPKADWSMPHETTRQVLERWRKERK